MMVRVPQERRRKPAKKYVSDLTPTNLERQGYFGTDRRKPGSVRKPPASVMYDYTTGEVIYNFDVPDLVVAPNETISVEPVITAPPAPAEQQTGNQRANAAEAIYAQYSRDALPQFDPQLFDAIKSAVQTQNLTIINTIDSQMTTFMDDTAGILNKWIAGNDTSTEAAIKQKISVKYAETKNRILVYVAENVSTPAAQPPVNAQPAEEVYEGQTDTNSGDESPAPSNPPPGPQALPEMAPPPGVPPGHNPFTGKDTQELTMIREELSRELANFPEMKNDPYFVYDYNMITQELNNRALAPIGRAQLAGVRQTTLRRMRQGAQVDVNQQVGDLFGAHNNLPHQHQVRQQTTESTESIDGLGSVFLKTRAAMGRLLG